MSQLEDTLREELRQQLRRLKEDEGADWLRELVGWVLQELSELEFTELLGAEPYERNEERRGYRNGHRSRELRTRVGALNLRIPRDREGRFSTEIFARYQRSEKALVLALQKIYLQGVSTRRVRRITEKLCETEWSPDQASQMAQALDGELERWRSRPLKKRHPYLAIDGRYEYVGRTGRWRAKRCSYPEGGHKR